MKSSKPAPPRQDLLVSMKLEAERLWKLYSDAPVGTERQALRDEYQKAVSRYDRQRILVEGIDQHVRRSGEHAASVVQPPKFRLPSEKRPDPFSYTDYRELVLDWLKQLQSEQAVGLNDFCRITGVSALSLVRAIRRWRPLPRPDFERIIAALDVTETERAFLRVLHCLSDTDSIEMARSALRELLRFSEFRKRHPQGCEAWRYLSQWYYVVVREMASLPGFQADPGWIQKRLWRHVERNELKQALEFLSQAGFIEINEDGTVKALEKGIECPGGVFRLALRDYHRQMLACASESIHLVPSIKRALLGRTVAIPAQRFEEVRRLLDETLERVASLAQGAGPTDNVYHVELTLVPMTKAPGEKN